MLGLVLLCLPVFYWFVVLLFAGKELRHRLEWHWFPHSATIVVILIFLWFLLGTSYLTFFIFISFTLDVFLILLFIERLKPSAIQKDILKDVKFRQYKRRKRSGWYYIRETSLVCSKNVYTIEDSYYDQSHLRYPSKRLRPYIGQPIFIQVSPYFKTFYTLNIIPKLIWDSHIFSTYVSQKSNKST